MLTNQVLYQPQAKPLKRCVCVRACMCSCACMHACVCVIQNETSTVAKIPVKNLPYRSSKVGLAKGNPWLGVHLQGNLKGKAPKTGFFKEGRSFIGVFSHQGAHLSSGYFFTKVRTVPHSTNMLFSFCCSQTLGATAATRSLRATSRSIVS